MSKQKIKIIQIRKIGESELEQLRIIKEHYGLKTASSACMKAVEEVAKVLKYNQIQKLEE
jgi:hypothetical protein